MTNYTFQILGVSPILDFFYHQQEIITRKPVTGVEYLGTYQCTLDALIEGVETSPSKQTWEMDRVVDTVLEFWINNSDKIRYWKARLYEAGKENLIISRVADSTALRAQFELLL